MPFLAASVYPGSARPNADLPETKVPEDETLLVSDPYGRQRQVYARLADDLSRL